MSTDRELLELAAKAVGEPYFEHAPEGGLYLANGEHWQPLTDDGDAFRLLAAMPSLWSLGLKFGSPSIVMDVGWGFKGIKVTKFNGQNTDRATVMRRAIVEAAAEMGRSM
jgi:hypothetical protein